MGSIKEASLRLSLKDNVSAPAKLIAATLKGLNQAVNAFNTNRLASNAAFSDAAMGAAVFGIALAYPIKQAMKFQDALADFNKLANLSETKLRSMGSEFVQLSREIPLTTEELLGIGSAVASTGAPLDQIIERTRLIAKASVAWGVGTEEAAESLSKLQTAMGLSNAETEQLADTINYLGNSTAAEAPQIANFEKRVGSLGKQAGLSAEETAAFGASLISTGVESDVAATGFQAMVRALVRGKAATAAQERAFKRLGLTGKQTARDMQIDGDATVIDVLERLRALPADERLSVANQLFGDEGRPILALVDQIEFLKKNLKDANDQTKTAGSIQGEYNGAVATTSARLKILRNRVTAAAKSFGDALLPSVDSGASSLGDFADKVEAFVRLNPEMVKRITLTAAGMVGLRLAATGARAAMYAMLRPTNLLIAGLGWLAYQNFDSVQAALKDLVAFGKDLSGTAFAQSFMSGAGATLKALGEAARSAVSYLRELSAEGSGLRAWLDSVAGSGAGAALGAVAVGLGSILASAALLGPVLRPLGTLVRLVGRLAAFGAGLSKTAAGLKNIGSVTATAATVAGAGAGAAGAPPAKTGKSGWGWLGNALSALNAYDLIASIPSDQKELQKFMADNKANFDAKNKWLESNVGSPRSWLESRRTEMPVTRLPDGSYDQGADANRANWQRQFGGVAFEGGRHRVAAGAAPAPGGDTTVSAPVQTTVNVALHGVMVDQVLDAVRQTARSVVDAAMAEMQSALQNKLTRSTQTSFSGARPYGD